MNWYDGFRALNLGEYDSQGSYEGQFSRLLGTKSEDKSVCPVKALTINTLNNAKKIKLSKEKLLKDYNNAIQYLSSKGYSLKDLEIHVNTEGDYSFTKEEIDLFSELKQIHKKTTGNNKDIYFIGLRSERNVYPGERVFQANQKSLDVATSIQNLSPFEQVCYIYHWITDRMYNGLDDRQNSASFVGALTSEKIICVGYAQILIETLKKLGIQGIELYEASTGKRLDHATALIYIKDSKYNIDGYYYFDPTWDARKAPTDTKQKFANFAVAPQQREVVKDWKKFDLFDTTNFDLYKIKDHLDFYFPNTQERMLAEKYLNEIKTNQMSNDSKTKLKDFVEELQQKYGLKFYRNEEAQKLMKDKAQKLIIEEGKNPENYNLDAYFSKKNMAKFDEFVSKNFMRDIKYGYFDFATNHKFNNLLEKTFLKRHPNYSSTPISEISMMKAGKVAIQQYQMDTQNQWNLSESKGNKQRGVSLTELIELYKNRNAVSKNGFYSASKYQWGENDPWRIYPKKNFLSASKSWGNNDPWRSYGKN